MFGNILLMVVLAGLTACAGVRTNDQAYSAHAENFNILFFQIPGGDTQKRALAQVPEGAEIATINSTPTDLTSLFGFINRLIGIDITFVNGTVNKED